MKGYLLIINLILINVLYATAQETKKNLQDTTINLKEVVVKNKIVRHEPGMDIIDAVQLRKGKTNLVDLLSDVPGLIVTDDNITIQGKGNILIMLNGRLKKIPSNQLTQILKSYQADNIAKIEIIKNPGAKYDAEGDIGIINIITERKRDFLGGGAGEQLSYNTKWKNSTTGNLNYSHGRITSSINAGWTYGQSPYTESYVANYTDRKRFSNSQAKTRVNSYNIIGALDIRLDSLSTLGLEASYASSYARKNGSNTVKTFGNDDIIQETGLSKDFSFGPPQKNLNFSLYLDRNWSREKSLTFIMDIFRYTDDRKYSFFSTFTDGNGSLLDKTDKLRNSNSRHLKGVSGTLDFNTPLPMGIQLATGIKTTITTTENGLHYDVSTLPYQNDNFTYVENIYATYASFSKQVSRVKIRLGTRYEYTHTNAKSESGDNTPNNYGRLFPDIVVLYSMKNGSSWQLSSRGGINRPFIRAVNPFTVYSNSYSSAKGNPTIEPSYWYNVQITNNLAFKGGEFSTTVRYAKAFNIIKQITEMNTSDGTMTTQWRNAYDTNGGYLDFSLYYSGLKWMRLSLLTEISYQESKGNSKFSLKEEKDLYPFLYGTLRFYFDKQRNMSGFINGSYTGKQKNATGILKDNYNVNCGLTYTCLKNKLNLTLSVQNVIASHYRGTSYSNDGMTFVFNNNFSYRRLAVGASFSFGKSINAKRKTHSNTDIEQRF